MKEQDKFKTDSVHVRENHKTDNRTTAESRANITSNAFESDGDSLVYPMTMPSAEDRTTEHSSTVSAVTDNGEFEPILTDNEMSLRNTGEPSPEDELFSDTIS